MLRMMVFYTLFLLASAQEASLDCNIMDMYSHLLTITTNEECVAGRNEGHGPPANEPEGTQWIPGA